jgi:hypothetical protein
MIARAASLRGAQGNQKTIRRQGPIAALTRGRNEIRRSTSTATFPPAFIPPASAAVASSSVFARTPKLTRLTNRKGYQLQRRVPVELSQERLTVDRNTYAWKAYSDG